MSKAEFIVRLKKLWRGDLYDEKKEKLLELKVDELFSSKKKEDIEDGVYDNIGLDSTSEKIESSSTLPSTNTLCNIRDYVLPHSSLNTSLFPTGRRFFIRSFTKKQEKLIHKTPRELRNPKYSHPVGYVFEDKESEGKGGGSTSLTNYLRDEYVFVRNASEFRASLSTFGSYGFI
jgi:hypothetical protein